MSNSKEQLFSDEYVKMFLGSTEFDSFEERWYKWERYVKQNPPKKEERDYSGKRFKYIVYETIIDIKCKEVVDVYRYKSSNQEKDSNCDCSIVHDLIDKGAWVEVKEEKNNK